MKKLALITCFTLIVAACQAQYPVLTGSQVKIDTNGDNSKAAIDETVARRLTDAQTAWKVFAIAGSGAVGQWIDLADGNVPDVLTVSTLSNMTGSGTGYVKVSNTGVTSRGTVPIPDADVADTLSVSTLSNLTGTGSAMVVVDGSGVTSREDDCSGFIPEEFVRTDEENIFFGPQTFADSLTSSQTVIDGGSVSSEKDYEGTGAPTGFANWSLSNLNVDAPSTWYSIMSWRSRDDGDVDINTINHRMQATGATASINVDWPTTGGTPVLSATSPLSVNATTGAVSIGSTIGVTLGGTGVATLTGIAKGNGTSAFSAAAAGTDYVAPGAVTSNGITMSTGKWLGRYSASTGAVQQLTPNGQFLVDGSGNISLNGALITSTGTTDQVPFWSGSSIAFGPGLQSDGSRVAVGGSVGSTYLFKVETPQATGGDAGWFVSVAGQGGSNGSEATTGGFGSFRGGTGGNSTGEGNPGGEGGAAYALAGDGGEGQSTDGIGAVGGTGGDFIGRSGAGGASAIGNGGNAGAAYLLANNGGAAPETGMTGGAGGTAYVTAGDAGYGDGSYGTPGDVRVNAGSAGGATGKIYLGEVNGAPTEAEALTVETGLGFRTGAGGTQTQGTSKSTTVVLNARCGTITTHAANLAAGTIVSFTLTNSTISSTDVIVVQHDSGGTLGAYTVGANSPGSGSCQITIRNNTAGGLAEPLTLRFIVFDAVNS